MNPEMIWSFWSHGFWEWVVDVTLQEIKCYKTCRAHLPALSVSKGFSDIDICIIPAKLYSKQLHHMHSYAAYSTPSTELPGWNSWNSCEKSSYLLAEVSSAASFAKSIQIFCHATLTSLSTILLPFLIFFLLIFPVASSIRAGRTCGRVDQQMPGRWMFGQCQRQSADPPGASAAAIYFHLL